MDAQDASGFNVQEHLHHRNGQMLPIRAAPPRTGSPHITADTTVASGELSTRVTPPWPLTPAVLGRDVLQGTSLHTQAV